MGARAFRAAASAGALCGWLAGSAPGAPDQSAVGGVAAAAEQGSVASQLVLQTEDRLGFLVDASAPRAGTFLFKDGQTSPQFRCGAEGVAGLAIDPESMGVRRLQLLRAPSATSLLDNLRPLAGGWGSNTEQPEEPILSVTNARLQVSVGAGADSSGLPTLHAKLEQPLPDGTSMQVPSSGEMPASLVVNYDCWRDGRAVIELRLQVMAAKGPGEEVCLRWAKVCALGWGNLDINQGRTVVLTNGAVVDEWKSLMSGEGTYETVTKLTLSSKGVERLRPPTVVSSQKLLKVEIRGEFYFGEAEGFEVTGDPVTISVVYTCESDGSADVALTLEKAVLSDAHRPEQLQIQWRKLCGATIYRHLQIFLKSDTFQNSTQAVGSGVVLPGFVRPCRTTRIQGSAPPPSGAAAGPGTCEAGALVFEVSPKDRRTSVELHVDKEAALEPPALQPPPDLSYDRRILQATFLSPPHPPVSSGKAASSRKLVQTLRVKYTCLRDGESVIMVTLHVLAHKPIDLAWRKRCAEPKVRVGKALTAPQAMIITVLICGIVALVCCLIFVFCGQDDKRAVYEYDNVANGGPEGGAQGFELAARQGGKHGPGPTRFGGGSAELGEEDEEVTFH